MQFLKMASDGKVREAYEKYVHSDFVHHNAYFKGDNARKTDTKQVK